MFQPSAALTINNAKPALEAGLQAIQSGQAEFDLALLTTVDSAAVATLITWRRAAMQRGLVLRFVNVPPSLRNLADLYGVAELLHH
ncbi:MAG: hypothetical protein JWQ23_15 [Herminiimonas sp.]|jgi:phospholipid transport system transporter-binding protein|nr:hypothetical protein [Herminiimonas sp.]